MGDVVSANEETGGRKRAPRESARDRIRKEINLVPSPGSQGHEGKSDASGGFRRDAECPGNAKFAAGRANLETNPNLVDRPRFRWACVHRRDAHTHSEHARSGDRVEAAIGRGTGTRPAMEGKGKRGGCSRGRRDCATRGIAHLRRRIREDKGRFLADAISGGRFGGTAGGLVAGVHGEDDIVTCIDMARGGVNFRSRRNGDIDPSTVCCGRAGGAGNFREWPDYERQEVGEWGDVRCGVEFVKG